MREIALGSFVVLAAVACAKEAETPPAAPPAEQAAASQPASGPASASSLPADHSTSSAAVDLGTLFKMPQVGDVVLTVGTERVKKGELEQALRALQVEVDAAGAPGDLSRFEVLRSAVDRLAERARRRLLADELGVQLDDARVKAWLHDLELRMEANPSFKVFLMRAGKDADARKQDAENTVLWQQVQDQVLQQVLKESESLARTYYDKNQAQFTEREGVEAWRILIKAPRSMVQRDRDIAKSRAEKVYATAVKAPANFENLARHHSEGGKGPHGGFIGWVPRGALSPDLEKQLFAAKPNTILPMVEVPIGYYIYKAGRKRNERIVPFDAVKEDILRKVFPARVSKKVEEHMKRLEDRFPAESEIPELAMLQKKEQARIEAVKAKLQAMENKR